MNIITHFFNPQTEENEVRYERMSLPLGAVVTHVGDNEVLPGDVLVYEIPASPESNTAILGKVAQNILPMHGYVVMHVRGSEILSQTGSQFFTEKEEALFLETLGSGISIMTKQIPE